MKRDWQKPYEKRHKTVRVVCVACVKTSHVTLYGLPNEYRGLVGQEKCVHCGTVGKLATNDLAKTRAKPDTTRQLQIEFPLQGFLGVRGKR